MITRKRIKVSFLGDIFPAELPYTVNYGIKSKFINHGGIPWINQIRRVLHGSDLTIANLESPLVFENNIKKEFFYGHPNFVNFLKKCGIGVLNIANNHILEHGSRGFEDTVYCLKNANLDIIGLHDNVYGSNIVFKEINEVNIAIAGFSNVDLSEIDNNNNFAVLNEKNLLSVLKKMKECDVELKIFIFHWGNEYINFPSYSQRELAYMLIDNGIDIIVGHHPHVIQPYERYKQGHIFYSLGNFLFDYNYSKKVSIGLVPSIIFESKKSTVCLDGVRLSYKKTIDLIPQKKFLKYYNKIDRQYIALKKNVKNFYEEKYIAQLKKEHFIKRILMKLALIKEMMQIKQRDKIYLVKNFFNYYKWKIFK